MLFLLVLAQLLGFTAAASLTKFSRDSRDNAKLAPRQSRPGTNYQVYTFDQIIDHFPTSSRYEPHTNATFKQRYVFDDTYYKPGGPVYLYISGETSVESRFSNLRTGIIQILMQATDGLGIILENRYYGDSYPFNASTTDQLAYLSTEQTIADNAYFAQHIQLPGISGNITAPDTPWILYGGSLAGAQTAFSVKTYGDILYGGISSSGVIYVTLGYPEWYNPIQKWGPQDCVTRINNIVAKIDHLMATNNTKAVQQLKEIFGLGDLKDDRDFAMTIAFPLGGPMNYPTNTWQELNWYPPYSSDDFFDFCYNVTDVDMPANLTAVDNELAHYTNGESWLGLGGWTNYIKQVLIPICDGAPIDSTSCFGTQNVSYWSDTSNGDGRSYLYSTCTEQGAYQVAPASGPSLILKVLQVNYTQQWCTWGFPAGTYNSIPSTPDLTRYTKYGGLNFSADRLAFIDGNQDVWLDLCYHSNFAPEPRHSTELHPEQLITTGGHHWDSYGILNITAEPQFIREAHLFEIRTVQRWLKDFKSWRAKLKRGGLMSDEV